MADKTIPQLPSQSAATDLDLLVIVNSGETTTSKITRADLLNGTQVFKSGDASQSIVPNYFNSASATETKTTYLDKLRVSGATTTIGTGSNTITAGSLGNLVIGTSNNVGTSNKAHIVIGDSNNVTGGGGVGSSSGMIVNGNGIQATSASARYGLVVGGSSTYQASTGILVGDNCNLGGTRSGLIGSSISNLANFSFATGDSNSITNTGSAGGIIGGQSLTLTHARSVMLGGQTKSSLYTDTAHAQNLHIFNTESYNVIAGGNVGGNIDVDCSLGTIFTFTITANTTPNFINLKTGQRFEFIVDNTTFSVPSATINGVSGNVYAKNGTISPSNNSITHYTATYDGTRLFLDEEGQFQAV